VIGEELGRGGIAIVYRAVHRTLPSQGKLAIKVAFRSDSQRDKRFIREFERLRVIAIVGVARVYEAGATEDLLWYVMDEVPGHKMDRCIAAGRSVHGRVRLAQETGARLMDVLAGIHQLGFIHRDIKPSNVLVDDHQSVHVLDFGLVRLLERGDTLTRAGRLVGTVAFMSPEQTTGIALTAGSDIFSAGLVLYEGLVGPRERPHKQEEWLGRMCLQRVVPLCIREPAIPRGLSNLVDQMLALDPHDRPTASECAQAFRELQHGRGTPDWPDPPQFVGRTNELDELIHAFDPGAAPLHVLQGPTGSGRSRLLEQVQRRALLYGTPRISGRCMPEVPGAAIRSALRQLLLTHSDGEWRARVTGPDTDVLLAMWPTLPLNAPPPSNTAPTLKGVAKAVAATIHRAVESTGLMLVIEGLDQVDGLTARVIQYMVDHPPERLAIFATYDDRWASDRARRLLASLSDRGKAVVHILQDLSGPQASKLASSLTGDEIGLTVGPCSPQRAREDGLSRLALRMGERFSPVPAEALPLALARRALPGAVLAVMDIDPDPLVDAGILVVDSRGLYSMAGQGTRTSALALLPDRCAAEDVLADALTRGGMGAERWRDIAAHILRGHKPDRALGPAIQAAVHAVRTGHLDEARSWLMTIDPLPRDPGDPTYQSLRFELAWCRAQTSLGTDISRIREDLVAQALERAQGEQDQARVQALQASLLVRQGRVADALHECQRGAKHPWTARSTLGAGFCIQAARICLNLGHADAARAHLREAAALKESPEYSLAQADLANMEGETQRCLSLCRGAIAQTHSVEQAGDRARLSLRLGTALMDSGDRPGATQAILKASEVLRVRGHRADTAEAHVRIADLALGRGHPNTARVWLEPISAISERFGLDRVRAETSRLKLAIATTLDDSPAAMGLIAGWNPEYRGGSAGWQHAQVRWHWGQGELDKALQISEMDFIPTTADVHLAIDRALLLLHTGDRSGASRVLSPAMEHAESQGLGDLSLLADLVAGAIAPEEDGTWEEHLRLARSNPWMELSLMCMAIDGQRWLTIGDRARARQSFTILHGRAHHLEDALKTKVANLGMRCC
jgi:tetratricopeptide (TPR) repeat protein